MFDIHQLSENIKSFRELRGMTQCVLSEAIGVSAQAISKWECGTSVPDIENLCLLAELFGVSVDALLGHAKTMKKVLAAVDAGGSKTEFLLFTEDGIILDRNLLSASNPNVVGMDNCLKILTEGINKFSFAMHLTGIFVGGAGFLINDNWRTIQKELKKQYPWARIDCQTDIVNVIASSGVTGDCMAVICGTGSVVVVKKKGCLNKISGWGYLLNKYGSGFDIGRDALCAALEYKENLGEKTVIADLFEEIYKKTPHQIMGEAYQKDSSFLATFAPLVFKAYHLGDNKAGEILKENAGRLSYIINSAAKTYSIKGSVILSGSIFSKEPIFVDMLKENLNKELTVLIPPYPQIIGACVECAKMCDVKTEILNEKFLTQYYERKNNDYD